MSDTFLTPEQAAKMLNLSAYTIRAYARQGVIPAHKIGRTWRFSKTDLEEWVLTNGRAPSSESTEGLLVARDRSSSAASALSSGPTGGHGAVDTHDERSRAIKTLLEIRARARRGSVSTILRESRRELLDRGRTDRGDK